MKFKKTEIYSSALVMAIGVATIIGSLNYDIKTLARMGPGYFPLILGTLLVIISVLLLITQPKEPKTDPESQSEEAEQSNGASYRPWLCVLIAIVLFIFIGKYGGLVPATFTLVALSAYGDKENSIKACLGLATFITALAVGIFHFGLSMQFPLFTWG